jgi:hypothetical protein
MSDSIDKQMIINRLPLPEDILGEIKELIFFDKITSKNRQQKKKIIETIRYSAHTMVNPIYFDNNDLDFNMGYYTFTNYTEYEGWIQLQNYFCLECGNYIIHYVQSPASHKVGCNC